MNVFQFSFFASPTTGIIAGIHSTLGAPIWRVLAGAGSGLVLGLTCYFVAMALVGITIRLARIDPRKKRLSTSQRLAGLVAIVLPIIAPIAAWISTTYMAQIILG